MILSIDLASRFSAAVKLTQHGIPLGEFDSLYTSPVEFVEEIGLHDSGDTLIAIEDVPYGISRQSMTKSVTRLQGAIILKLAYIDALDRTVFINPATWQRGMGIYGKGKDAAHELAVELGYTAPDLIERWAHNLHVTVGKERSTLRAQLKKAQTDYEDAFLMGIWCVRNLDNIRDISGVQEPHF